MNKPYTPDPSHDVLRFVGHPLDPIFKPKSVAVVGATEKANSVGRMILWNLISNPFGGVVYPINPKRSSVMGIKAYPSIKDIHDQVDLAVIVTPAVTVPGIMAECVEAGVKGAIIISAGFKEIGPAGKALEEQVFETAKKANIRIIGPNCLGAMTPYTGLNATFAGVTARPGRVAFLSQSGALGTAILDWSLANQVGLSAFISVGSMSDVGWGDLIDYFGNDPNTQSIVIYMETIGNARHFFSAAREVALNKPIIVIKAGRTEAAAKAAASHTGSLAGSDDVLDAAFTRCGVLRVNSISEMFDLAEILAKQPRPKGPRLTMITNAGGPGVLATDSLIRRGGELAEVSQQTIEELNKVLPSAWSHSNPIDILGDADADRYAKTLQIAAKDPNSDGLLVVLTPQSTTEPTKTAELLRPYAKIDGKPVFASWMGGSQVAAGVAILDQAGIPAFEYPDAAVNAFVDLWRFTYNLKGLYETPTQLHEIDEKPNKRMEADKLIRAVRKEGRTILTEVESKAVLETYGIPVNPTKAAATEEEAVKLAEGMGYPVVVKLLSKTITHKSDVGGVILNIRDAEGVRAAFKNIRASVDEKAGKGHFDGVAVQAMVSNKGYEVILGSSLDVQMGPVLLFGMGGKLVEVFKDRALALPPLNTNLAKRLMEQTKIYKALQGVRGEEPADIGALSELLVRFSYLVVEQPLIKEIDINPILVSGGKITGLDARVVLHDPSVDEEKLPRPTIRPYPSQYINSLKLKDGTPLTLRPIRPEDEPLVAKFHENLSEQTVYMRYFSSLKLSQRTAHERLTRICFTDFDREMALVAVKKGPRPDEESIIGIGRLSRRRGTDESEFAVLVVDQWQNKGLGTLLLQALVDVGFKEKIKKIVGYVLAENQAMQVVSKKNGFTVGFSQDDGFLKAELDL